jgi:tetratricopeptide (TPR) repeat protein
MKRVGVAFVVGIAIAGAYYGCGPAPETSKPPEVSAPRTKESIFLAGHQAYLEQQFDTAIVLLKRAVSMDSTYLAPVRDLAQLYYEQGMRQSVGKEQSKSTALRASRTFYSRMEALGVKDADVYERLCELSVTLDDDRSFLKYARKYAELFPYDRQMYNLGIAYFNVGDFQQVIKTQKEAAGKFKDSPYLGGFYRQMGRAYRKIDRDQTAERMFNDGIRAVDGRIAELRQSDPQYKTGEGYRRLADDKVSILTELKRLHQIYKADDKLEQVERQLKEMEHGK